MAMVSPSQWSLERVQLFKALGAEGVELGLENNADIDAPKVLEALETERLLCMSVCSAYGAGRDRHGISEQEKTALDYSRDCIDVCATLGARLFVGPHYSIVGRAGAETKEAERYQSQLIVGNLTAICKYAGDRGVSLGVEPFNRFETDSININTDPARLCEDVGADNIRVDEDLVRAGIEERNVPLSLVATDNYLPYLRAVDSHRGPQGAGCFDWRVSGMPGLRSDMEFGGPRKLSTVRRNHREGCGDLRDFKIDNEVLAQERQQGISFLNAMFA